MRKSISVVIPTFDRAVTTLHAIDSVVTSTPDKVEIIVVDDCGTAAFEHAAKENSHGVDIYVIRLSQNVGPGMARKAGVERASGQFIAFLDSDDRYSPGWVDQLLVETDGKDPRCPCIMIGHAKGMRGLGPRAQNLLLRAPARTRLLGARVLAIFFNPFYTSSICMHRSLCRFLDGQRYCEDYYTNVLALQNTECLVLMDVIACTLGRAQHSPGGLTSQSARMYEGELTVRRALARSDQVRLRYRMLVPLGMVYQRLRRRLKQLTRLLSKSA